MRVAAILGLLALGQDSISPADVRASVEALAKASYAYQVTGRFTRGGEFIAPGTLTARIDGYRSIRHGARIVVKGPEGLWRTPDEIVGEKVQNPPKDAADKVKTLEEAQAPHEMALELLEMAKPGTAADSGGGKRHAALPYAPEKIRADMEKALEKGIQRGTVDKPDRILWDTLRGKLVVFFDKESGRVVGIRDDRSVKLHYDGRDTATVYKVELGFDLSAHGTAKAEIPDEVKARLKIE